MISALLLAAALSAAPTQVALTLDDLPFLGEPAPGESVESATAAVLTTLRARKLPATAFVTCGRDPDRLPMLKVWIDASVELGNHTRSHKPIERMGEAAWRADV